MKNFSIGVIAGIWLMIFMVWICNPINSKKVTRSQPFKIDNKEWLCLYTPKQVEINILEEQLEELRK